MPRDFITEDGFGITERCRRYLTPLIQGEDYPKYKDWPAGLRDAEERRGGEEARRRSSCQPAASTVKRAVHSSVPGAASVIAVSRHVSTSDAGACRSRTTAVITSWLSANTPAQTTTDSPGVRLIANRPVVDPRPDVFDDHAPAERLGNGG